MTKPGGSEEGSLLRAIDAEIAKAHAAQSPSQRRAKTSERRRQLDQYQSQYHQARVLILICEMAGPRGSVDGLTKLAKLDFLLRYPVFLEQLAKQGIVEDLRLPASLGPTADESHAVESRMIRYKYGPWDDRYYSIVGSLIGRGLVKYGDGKARVALQPTPAGRAVAEALALDPAWTTTRERCAVLKRAFGRVSGSHLKNLIYEALPEVVDRPHRQEI